MKNLDTPSIPRGLCGQVSEFLFKKRYIYPADLTTNDKISLVLTRCGYYALDNENFYLTINDFKAIF